MIRSSETRGYRPGMRRSLSNARKASVRPAPRRVQESKSGRPRIDTLQADPLLRASREDRYREIRALQTVLWISISGFVLLSLLILSFQLWIFLSGDKPETRVPDIVGLPYENAVLSVEQAGLVLKIRAEKYTDEIEANRIIEQIPTSGAQVKVGREILVDISLGSRTLKTPNVIGRLKDQAINDLESMGLAHSITTQYSDLAPEGTVINQSPPGGSKIALGEEVALVIAERPPSTMIEMPHLEGLNYDEAIQILNENRLALRQVRRIYQPDIKQITVFNQFPLAGSQVRESSEVILTLACPLWMESQSQRSFKISVSVPQSAGKVQVRIVVQDRYQTKEVYSAQHTGPTTVEQLISSYGRTTVKIYFDNKIVREESF